MTDKDQELEELINEPDASIEATAEVMNIEIEDVTLYVAIHGVCKEINMIKNN